MRNAALGKLLLMLVALAASLWPVAARAEDPTLGLGLIFFSPTGISVNYRLSPTSSIDAAFSWDLYDALDVHGDYLLKTPSLFQNESAIFTIYYGAGGRLQLLKEPQYLSGKVIYESHERLGIRLPLGLAVWFPAVFLEFFSEAAAVTDFVGKVDFTTSFAIGGRHYL